MRLNFSVRAFGVFFFGLVYSLQAFSKEPHVIIMGGGVAGMSAAQELAERGFGVTVYETKDIPGGKARSIVKPGSGIDGRKEIPGEHGFRFFPGFYKHVTDSMKRIPYGANRNGVFDNLIHVPRSHYASIGRPKLLIPTRFPKELQDIKDVLKALSATKKLNIPPDEMADFARKLDIYLTSCEERRVNEYDAISWYEFMDAENKSIPFNTYLVRGATTCLVAARAEEMSFRTGASIMTQLLLSMVGVNGGSVDRILNGPTNEVWIEPWLNYLKTLGVDYHLNVHVDFINYNIKNNKIESITVTENGTQTIVAGDYYIAAVPVEKIIPMITKPMIEADPQLGLLKNLKTEWMVGLQLFLKKDVKIARAHSAYFDSPWALTSISQAQFWDKIDLSQYGDGRLKGILSIDISDWNTPGVALHKKPAKDCTPEEIKEEVLAQIKMHLDPAEALELEESVYDWFLDPGITFHPGREAENSEPLLINTINSWASRPETETKIPNFFLASDYVRTYTDLATMEGANEAARRAVNGIISKSGSKASPCKLWPFKEPWTLSALKALDRLRYKAGLPHFSCTEKALTKP